MATLKRTRSDVIFDTITYIVLTIALLTVIYPLYYLIIASISNPTYVLTGQVILWPKGFSLEGYEKVFRSDNIMIGYRNSLFYTTLGTCINLILTITSGYALSRKDLKGRGIFMFILTFTMFFGGGLIPTYLLVKRLGMVNTVWAMMIPNAVAVWNIIITRTFFQTNIPDELLDASLIDGCSNTKFFLRIVIPLSPAIIAVMVLFYAVGHWNSYFQALVYIHDKNLYPLQLVLRNVLIMNQADQEMLDHADAARLYQMIEVLKYALIIVASVPVLILYPFIQKYFVKGVMIGSIKG